MIHWCQTPIGYTVQMRNERGISFIAIVVMLCCMGSVIGAYPISNSNTHVTNVIVQIYTCDLNDQVSKKLDAPERTTSCRVQIDVPFQIEIEELQNLPPPAFAV